MDECEVSEVFNFNENRLDYSAGMDYLITLRP